MHRLGAKLTYTGDQPFLLRLILGISKDDAKIYSSKIPMYVGEGSKLDPEYVNPQTGQRTDVEVQFRTDIPRPSLVYIQHITTVTIDSSHARTRCTETDLKKWVEKLIREKNPDYVDMCIRRLESNLTDREVKKPSFKFKIEKNKCGPISLSGSEAAVAIADRDELGTDIQSNLFDGVWTREFIQFDEQINCLNVLSQLHPSLVNTTTNRILVADLAELWRQSINYTFQLLRNERKYNKHLFKKWAETYYQVSLAVFPPNKALTPYKLKTILNYQILNSGYVKNSWNHMTEAVEKSNHRAQKDFYTKTMMGGGQLHHHDPMFLELYFTFCRIHAQNDGDGIVASTDRYYEAFYPGQERPTRTYQDIVSAEKPEAALDIGATRDQNSMLTDLRFVVLGSFGKLTQEKVKQEILQLGGIVLSIDAAHTILKSHSKTPLCYVVLHDDSVLKIATTKGQQPPGKNNLQLAKNLQNFAGGDWKFLSYNYIKMCQKERTFQDPHPYELKPGNHVLQVKVNDIRALLLRQESTFPHNNNQQVSRIVYSKRFKNNLKRKRLDYSSGSETDNSVE